MIFTYITSGVEVVRLWTGPLPSQICFVNYFIKKWALSIYIFVSTIQSIFSHQIFCQWKHMKIMNDDLIARLIMVIISCNTLWLICALVWSPKPDLFMVRISKLRISVPILQFCISCSFLFLSSGNSRD